MDVTFTNVLEGARQYFQGLPAATSSTAGPTYSNTSENVLRGNESDPNTEHPPSSAAAYWPPQQQEAATARPPTREQTPIQRPPSHHSDSSSRPPSHSQANNVSDHSRAQSVNYYQGNYQEQAQLHQSFQFPRPQSREAPSNMSHHQFQQHVIQNPSYQQQQQQQQRVPSRQEQMMTPPASSQSYTAQTQSYYNYQQQQRSYYPVHSQPKSQATMSNNTYKVATSQPHSQNSQQENAYYKHLYTPHSQNPPSSSSYSSTNSKLPSNNHLIQDNSGKHDQASSVQNQAYRTTHNLPPIASLSLINYHSSRNNKDVVYASTTKSRTMSSSTSSTSTSQMTAQSPAKSTSGSGISSSSSASLVQQNSMRMSHPYMQHDYRGSSQFNNNQNRLPTSQNSNNTYMYSSTSTPTSTQNYSNVIMTTSNTQNSYSTQIHSNQSSSTNQQYYQQQQQQPNKLQSHEQQQQQRTQMTSNMLQQSQQQSSNSSDRVTGLIKQKRESPLDLSVKTVRTPADSTLDDIEQDARSKYFLNNNNNSNNNNRPPSSSNSSNNTSSITAHNYPTYDVYPNSFQRGLASARPLPATAPKVEFHPNFNASYSQQQNNYRRNPVQSVPDKNVNAQRITASAAAVAYQQNLNTARYPTVSVPTSAHVNSYIQSQQPPPKRAVENSSRIDFPPPGHGHKTSAHYPVATHDLQKKRPADTAPSSIIPNKMSKVDMWRQNIDQQIEQRLSSYKQQQQMKHTSNNNNNKTTIVNGNYPTINQERSKEVIHHAYQRHQYQTMPHSYPNTNQYLHPQNSHNQTYVPSVGAHQYPGYAYTSQPSTQQQNSSYSQTNMMRTNSTSSVSGNKNNLGGADKRVLSLLRNSLEIKEAQKKLEQEQQMHLHKHSRLDVQHPSTDVTAPLQPKPSLTNRHNVSPFTPTNFPDGGNNSLMYKLHIPKAIDSVNFDTESNKYPTPNSDRLLEEGQTVITNHVNPNGDLDGLAAFLAARIRTKAELKQVGPTHNAYNNNSQLQSPVRQDSSVNGTNNPNSVSPPKLIKERHAFPPRRRLFSRTDDETSNTTSNIPPRDNSGLRSSSETSVFDFPDSDSEGEMPVLERQTLEDMRRDRRSSSTKQLSEIKIESSSAEDDIFTQACDSFVEQLKSGSGKKRGRRKKMVEPDVLAKLETVTKEKPLDLDMTIKKEVDDDDELPTNSNEVKEAGSVVPKSESADDDDSDVPLIKCKNNNRSNTESNNDNKPISKVHSSSLNDLSSSFNNKSMSKEVEHVTPKKENAEPFSLKDSVLPRPAKKPNFGDGSHFCPGWEEEVYKYKKSLRMPPSLIQVTRPPHYHRLSTSLPDLDPYPNSPTPSLLTDNNECSKTKLSKVKSEIIDSDTESNHSFNLFGNKNNYDSEGSCSIKSLPNTNKESNSILDTLLERYGGKKKRKHKRKDDVHPRVLPKPEKVVELLPTPVNADDENKKNLKSSPVALGFRKKTIDNFKDVFLGSNKDLKSRRKARMKKQKISIKEVFGEDRPASAPPVTCLNHVKIKEEIDDNISLSSLIKKEDETSQDLSDPKQVLKTKLLNRNRKENNLLKTLVDRKIKTDLLEDQDEQDDDELSNKGDADCKSETPSIDGDECSVSGKKRNKFRNMRRKFSSGFDYIRKKKKSVKKEGQENDASSVRPPRRRGQFSKCNSGSVQDIQKEIKGWVLNKGIGETILHRSCRLGYEDITAFCLEKLEYIPSPKDNAGYTPLHEACARGHLSIAKMLLLYGANASESARGGIRPLHEAAEAGNVELVRLLLSYGADPLLTTYSGSTPLQMATDEPTIKLLENHINDIRGVPGPFWEFAGPATCFDLKETGFDVLADEPDSDPVSDEEDVEFEVSDTLLPNLYTLNGEASNDRWMLLQDLSSLLKIKSRDALLRQICPPASSTSPVNYKSVLRELKMSDFLEQAHCCQFLNTGEKINTRASKIALVKYTDKVRELLNVEKVTISVR